MDKEAPVIERRALLWAVVIFDKLVKLIYSTGAVSKTIQIGLPNVPCRDGFSFGR